MATHLVCLHCATAGLNGESLGSDEEQIVLMVYLLYDLANNKPVSLQHHYVRPVTTDISETIITDDCKAYTGLSEENVKYANSLEQTLDELERFLSAKEIHPQHGGKKFQFCTDGPLHLRMCLHPESFRKGINLPEHFYSYFDLRREFKKFYRTEQPITCLSDMMEFLNIEKSQSIEYGTWQCQIIAQIIQNMVIAGHQFTQPEVIHNKLEVGVCATTDPVEDELIVKTRGLPWQSSDFDIFNFFRGLNVAKGGVALCLSQQGRRNGEALIKFEDKEQRMLALRRHKHHLGQRYIEVYRSTGKDFLAVAGGNNREAQSFLVRRSDDGGQVIVRMRGLPYTCKPLQVVEFFREGSPSVEVLDGEDGILFVHQADGRATGDAFVLFSTEEEAATALKKNRQCIGSRYIELFKSTTAEVQQVLNRHMDPRNPKQDLLETQQGMAQSLLQGVVYHQQLIQGSEKSCLRLRGLPMEAGVNDIVTFLGRHSRDITWQGVHLICNPEGTPSGEAFIQMDNEPSARTAAMMRHNKTITVQNKKRVIEVLQCSGDEMRLILTNGITNSLPLTTLLPMTSQELVTPVQIMQHKQAPAGTFLAATSNLSQPVFHNNTNMLSCNTSFGPIPCAPQSCILESGPAATPILQQPNLTLLNTVNGVHGLGVTHSIAPYQPIVYWYPSPPVSPQSTKYLQTGQSTIMIKGLPGYITAKDILSFLEGIYEIQPDIQMLRAGDGLSHDVFVTFGSRAEMDKALCERNKKLLGNFVINLHPI